jgi:hypothetical protein
MPLPFLFYVALIGLGISAAAAFSFWTTILNWASKSLFPWLQKHLPPLASIARTAFTILDKGVVSGIRQIRAAWDQLRLNLVKMFASVEGSPGTNQFIQRITSWLKTESNQVTKVETTVSNVPWHELPDEVREQLLRTGNDNYELDVTEKREEELEQVT